jgi:hypothetical protein
MLMTMYGLISGGFLSMAMLKKAVEDGESIKIAPTVTDLTIPLLTGILPLLASEAMPRMQRYLKTRLV